MTVLKTLSIIFTSVTVTAGIVWGAATWVYKGESTNEDQNENIQIMLSNQDSIFKILKKQSETQIVLFEGQRGILIKVDRIEQGQKAIAKSQSDYIKENGKFNPKIMQILENLSPWYLMLEKKNQSNNQYMLTQCE